MAKKALGKVANGEDPQAEKRAKREAVRRRRMGETVSAALASWLKDEKQGPIGRWKGGLEGGSARAALSHIRRLDRMLGNKLLSEVTPREIERVVLASEAPATRNRALCAFRGFLAWAIRHGLIVKDPTTGMVKEHETARTRVLSDDEIRTLINAFDRTRYGRALRFLFLTALRRDEVLGLKWSWIDMEKGMLTVPPEAEKSGRVRDELGRAGRMDHRPRRSADRALASRRKPSPSSPSSVRSCSPRAFAPSTSSPRAPARARWTRSSQFSIVSAAAARTACLPRKTSGPRPGRPCCRTM